MRMCWAGEWNDNKLILQSLRTSISTFSSPTVVSRIPWHEYLFGKKRTNTDHALVAMESNTAHIHLRKKRSEIWLFRDEQIYENSSECCQRNLSVQNDAEHQPRVMVGPLFRSSLIWMDYLLTLQSRAKLNKNAIEDLGTNRDKQFYSWLRDILESSTLLVYSCNLTHQSLKSRSPF